MADRIMTGLPLTLPAIVGRVTHSVEHVRLADEITLHTPFGEEFRSDLLLVLVNNGETSVTAMGITGRQRVVQPQILDPDESDALLAALDGLTGIRRLDAGPDR